MPDLHARLRRLAAVALVGGGLAVGALGVAPDTTAQPLASVGAMTQVGDMATVSFQTNLRAGESPEYPSDESSDPPCDSTQGPCPDDGEDPGESPDDPGETPGGPSESPSPSPGDDELCEINPELCGDEFPPGNGGDDPESPEGPGTNPPGGPSVDGPPEQGSGPDDSGSDGCADGGLGCAPEGAPEDQQGRVIPESDAAAEGELADTGASNLVYLGLVGAVLIGVGGLLALVRHHRGKHRA